MLPLLLLIALNFILLIVIAPDLIAVSFDSSDAIKRCRQGDFMLAEELGGVHNPNVWSMVLANYADGIQIELM